MNISFGFFIEAHRFPGRLERYGTSAGDLSGKGLRMQPG
jgi:hypothetical protein